MTLITKPPPCSLARLHELVSYDPETGEFRWKPRRCVVTGKLAGTISPNGHIVIMLQGKLHYAHRLAWFYVTGDWPPNEIDHKNRQRADNRFSNLRLATRAQNQANKLPRNKLGIKGVYPRHGKFEAQIRIDNKTRWLGTFETAEEASVVYMAAAKAAFGEFARA